MQQVNEATHTLLARRATKHGKCSFAELCLVEKLPQSLPDILAFVNDVLMPRDSWARQADDLTAVGVVSRQWVVERPERPHSAYLLSSSR